MTKREAINALDSVRDYLSVLMDKAWETQDRNGYNCAYSYREKVINAMIWIEWLEMEDNDG